jgi:hypothetical protein
VLTTFLINLLFGFKMTWSHLGHWNKSQHLCGSLHYHIEAGSVGRMGGVGETLPWRPCDTIIIKSSSKMYILQTNLNDELFSKGKMTIFHREIFLTQTLHILCTQSPTWHFVFLKKKKKKCVQNATQDFVYKVRAKSAQEIFLYFIIHATTRAFTTVTLYMTSCPKYRENLKKPQKITCNNFPISSLRASLVSSLFQIFHQNLVKNSKRSTSKNSVYIIYLFWLL